MAMAAALGAIMSLSKNIKVLAQKLNEPNAKQDERIDNVEKEVKEHNDAIDVRVSVLEEAMACIMRDKINSYFEKVWHVVI